MEEYSEQVHYSESPVINSGILSMNTDDYPVQEAMFRRSDGRVEKRELGSRLFFLYTIFIWSTQLDLFVALMIDEVIRHYSCTPELETYNENNSYIQNDYHQRWSQDYSSVQLLQTMNRDHGSNSLQSMRSPRSTIRYSNRSLNGATDSQNGRASLSRNELFRRSSNRRPSQGSLSGKEYIISNSYTQSFDSQHIESPRSAENTYSQTSMSPVRVKSYEPADVDSSNPLDSTSGDTLSGLTSMNSFSYDTSPSEGHIMSRMSTRYQYREDPRRYGRRFDQPITLRMLMDPDAKELGGLFGKQFSAPTVISGDVEEENTSREDTPTATSPQHEEPAPHYSSSSEK